MRISARLACLVGLAGLLTACGSTKPIAIPPAEGFPNHDAQAILAHLPTPDSLWGSFEADMAVAYSMPGDKGSLNARVAYRRADSTLLRFRAPLGIEVLRALVTQDSLFVYNRLERKLYYGARDVGVQALPMAFRYTEVAAALFGYDELGTSTWTVRADSNRYVLTSADGLRTVHVDPGRWRIVAVDERDASGMIVEQRRFADFERIDGQYVPQRIVTWRPGEELRASITIRRLIPDPDQLSFDLGLRNDIQRIPVY